jgi:ring-1,2-phenylacetyl-CoA epoxidase subunit PaaC
MSEPVVALLLSLADDDFVLGYRDSEWTGIAPMLEEDVAMSSISQDEIGHARALYELVEGVTGRPVDELAYGRHPEEYRSCWLVERHRGDWAHTMARRYLYETADEVRVESLLGSSHQGLANVLAKVSREERYHTMHVATWLERLTAASEARARFLEALQALWPDSLGLWEPIETEPELLATGVMPASSAELRSRWLEQLGRTLRERGVPPPGPEVEPRTGGRRGIRSPGFEALWAEMTEVYRLDPQASW